MKDCFSLDFARDRNDNEISYNWDCMLQVGIVGLANVGKSTLFNALLKKQQALVANYPFATIEPNVGIVPVPDDRLNKLAAFFNNPPIVPATVKFVDIAGLVKGASQGAGLGNKFLANIREVDLICHVVRAFEDENIIREGSIDPKSDKEVVETELILADMQTVEKVLNDRKLEPIKKSALEKLKKDMDEGKLAKDVSLSDEELESVQELQLLTFKPVIYVYNGGIDDNDGVNIDAKLEAELSILSPEEQKEYLESLGINESGLDRLIKAAYQKLGLISFLTAGDKEVRAWTIKVGTKAPAAAGVIHTDFEKNFIKAEVISYEDYLMCNGEKKARELGKLRLEGREYVVNDGDVIEFKVGV